MVLSWEKKLKHTGTETSVATDAYTREEGRDNRPVEFILTHRNSVIGRPSVQCGIIYRDCEYQRISRLFSSVLEETDLHVHRDICDRPDVCGDNFQRLQVSENQPVV